MPFTSRAPVSDCSELWHGGSMPPKSQKRWPEPLPVGMQPSRPQPSTSGSASSSSAAPVPPAAKAAPKKKTAWLKTLQGKKLLARAIRHRHAAQNERILALLDQAPGTQLLQRGDSTLESFRQGGRQVLARVTLFLLQVLIRLVTHYRPSERVGTEYGTGVGTPPRLAICFLMEKYASQSTWESVTSIRRTLFMRALREGAATGRLAAVLSEELRSDVHTQTLEALRNHFVTVLAPVVRSGRLPCLDFSGRALDRQYDNCWKEPVKSICVMLWWC